jgi:hypothetical protein
MTDDHIAVKIDGVIYVKLEDVKPMRDRIEKLEALVKRLRDDNSSLIDDFDKDFLRQEARIEKLEAALRRIIDRAEYRMGHHVTDAVCAIAREALEETK